MAEDENDAFLAALQARAREALAHWDLGGQTPALLKYRENAVFRIILKSGEPAALRLHRPGYHDEQTLSSELSWMSTLRDAGLRVPSPVITPDGRQIVHLAASGKMESQHADIVSWMSGLPVGQSGVPLAHSKERLGEIFTALGTAMAQMHAATDTWTPPADFHRPSWGADGLLGEAPLWGRFWDCAGLQPQEQRQLSALRLALRAQIDNDVLNGLDYGLIHADLVRENVLVDGLNVELIDFDDAGYGWRMFDIATALFKNRAEPHYDVIREALVNGYRTVRPLPDSALQTLPLFMVLRSLTYIGWIGARSESPDAEQRLRRYVADALALADALEA
jgi:Ser/Thr protein kinase RdoA (MazF antagonist)